MNKELREEMEYLITCDDKAITPDVKDDVSLTLQYIDKLEDRINKTIEELELWTPEIEALKIERDYLLNTLRGENEQQDEDNNTDRT